MKKTSLLTLVIVAFAIKAQAQIPFPTVDSNDINNITASVLVHGDMWWNPETGAADRCTFPKGSHRNVGFASALWMSGYDDNSQLHVAAQTYRQDGSDYWPGPLDNNDTLSYKTSYYWANIWKVNRTDIQYFQSQSVHTAFNTPDAILRWPAKGNTYAQGNAGNPLTITIDMAPFIDVNHNGIYEPLKGDYPDIKGDQALWWVFSDNGPSHSQSHGRPLGVEIHAMSYAYKRGTLIDNVIYYEYTIVNRSPKNYNNFRAGLLADMDLGYAYDDFIGYDESHRMGITYNGTGDDGGAAGRPINSYGEGTPMVGVSLVSLPGDVGTSYVPAGSFTYYNNDFSPVGNPSTDTACNYYMRSRYGNGEHFTNDFKGRGIGSTAMGFGPECNYVFNGDPGDTTQWSECNCNNLPNDRRFILSSNDFSLPAGGTQKFTMALIVADSTGGCPRTNFSKIKIAADTAWAIYHDPPQPNLLPVTEKTSNINIYPNPAHDKLFIERAGQHTGEEYITVHNIIGQAMNASIDKNNSKITVDVSTLPPGFYNLVYRNEKSQKVAKFVKQ